MAGVLIDYAMGPKRPNRPGSAVMAALEATAMDVLGEGATIRVTSGMGPHGSPRHREGHAADVQFIDAQGRVVTLDDPRAREFALSAARNGITGLGAGSEYMGNQTFHMDLFPVDRYSANMGRAWGSWGNGIEADFVGAAGSAPRQTASQLMSQGVDPGLAHAAAAAPAGSPPRPSQDGTTLPLLLGALGGTPEQVALSDHPLLSAALSGGLASSGQIGVNQGQPRFGVQRGADGLDKFVSM